MRKFKILPSILMLVLCTAVLAVGIYAASPTSHSIVGTVKITAGGANVSITGYLDDGDGDFTDDVKVTNTYTSRTAQTISIYANALDFDCSSAFDISEVAEKKLYFKVDNLSSYSLGAYFLEGTVPEGGTTESNIAESKSFNGTMGTQTITNLITATFTPYSEVPANGSTNMYSTLKLNQLNSEASTVTLNLNLNIEKFNEELKPVSENSVQVKNANGANITISCELQNASITSTATISNSGVWEIGGFAFSEEKFNGQLMLQTIKIKMVVTNNDSVPVSVTITGDNNPILQNVDVSVIDCSYISPSDTEELSIQFSAVYDRDIDELSAMSIDVGNYIVNVNPVTEISDSDIKSRVEYDETGIVNGAFHYYIKYGDNPYYTSDGNKKLRWFIWAKDDGTGTATALQDTIDYDSETHTFLGGSTYFLISEYVLDVKSGDSQQFGFPYQNNYYYDDESEYMCVNKYKLQSNYYTGSNLRSYLNGMTIKDNYIGGDLEDTWANGDNINFLNEFNLTDDVIYSKISERKIENLVDRTLNSVSDSLVGFEGQSDKFWALSLTEFSFFNNKRYLTYPCDNSIGYRLSSNSTAGSWYLRESVTGGGPDYPVYVEEDGKSNHAVGGDALIANIDVGSRPAFALAI